MMKKWTKAEISFVDISNTEYGRPNERIDLTFLGVPIGDGPDCPKPPKQDPVNPTPDTPTDPDPSTDPSTDPLS